MRKKLTKFEQGYICAISCVANGFGCSTTTHELWNTIGRPTPEQALKSVMSQYDADVLARCQAYAEE
jgi:hypothetical protein